MMRATLLLKEKLTDVDGDLKEFVVWKVPVSVSYPDGVRYRLAFIPQDYGEPAVLYDNHHPKGHHKHLQKQERTYLFSQVDQLIRDFENDILHWKKERTKRGEL